MADPEAGIPFHKGHGTENDFVLLPDPDGALELTPARVRALCDRRRGLGADGVLRVVRTATLGGQGGPDAEAEWFMDYRNADGSVAEMCGNGVRVFARFLVQSGLVSGAGELPVGTRAGVRRVRFTGPGDEVSVSMGTVRSGGPSTAVVGGREFPGLVVDVGNPHLACVTDVALDELDLTGAPGYDPEVFPDGVNVELLNPTRDGVARMRVHERGVGETRSCGTGAVAAAVAALCHAGAGSGSVTVAVPGGRVRVDVAGSAAGSGPGAAATLTGPAVLVAAGEISADWWRALAG